MAVAVWQGTGRQACGGALRQRGKGRLQAQGPGTAPPPPLKPLPLPPQDTPLKALPLPPLTTTRTPPPRWLSVHPEYGQVAQRAGPPLESSQRMSHVVGAGEGACDTRWVQGRALVLCWGGRCTWCVGERGCKRGHICYICRSRACQDCSLWHVVCLFVVTWRVAPLPPHA